MPIRFNLALAIAPALGLLWLFQRWDAKRPEPPARVRNVVLFGMAICIPAAISEIIATKLLGGAAQMFGGVAKAFLVAAATEETLKLLVVLLYLWPKADFDEVMDGILYTAAASLGFALLENVLYSANSAVLGFVRAFTAVPLHAIGSGIMGYFVGRARLARGTTPIWLSFGLAIAIFIHGLYDWVVFSGGGFGVAPPNPLLGIVLVLPILGVFGAILYALVRHAQRLDDLYLGPPKPALAVPVAWTPGVPPGAGAAPWQVQPAAPPDGYRPHAVQPPGAQGPVSPFAATQWSVDASAQRPGPPKGWPPQGSGSA